MNLEEKIKVNVFNYHPDLDEIKDKYVITLKKEQIENAQNFLEKELKGLECDNCEEDSKGTIIVGVNTDNGGALLDFKDFCCIDFENKARRTLR